MYIHIQFAQIKLDSRSRCCVHIFCFSFAEEKIGCVCV